MLWKSVSTQNVRHDRREPPAITPPKNPGSVSVPQVAATFLNAEIAFPIPPARSRLRKEHAGIQQSNRPCCTLCRNTLPCEPTMQFTFQSLALCTLPSLLILHVTLSKSWRQPWKYRQVPTHDVERPTRTIFHIKEVLLPMRVSISPPKRRDPVPTS